MFLGFARTVSRNGLADTPSLQLCDIAMSCLLRNDLRWKFASWDFRETLQRTRFSLGLLSGLRLCQGGYFSIRALCAIGALTRLCIDA